MDFARGDEESTWDHFGLFRHGEGGGPGPYSRTAGAAVSGRESREIQRVKQHGVLLATAGLLLLPTAAFVLGLLGVSGFGPRDWVVATGLTLGVQAVLWWIPARGWDRRFLPDHRYLYLPMATAALLMGFYVYLTPELRHLILMAWFVALLFMAGLGGFGDVMKLSGFMAAVYAGVVVLLMRDGVVLDYALEFVHAGVFLLVCAFAGTVLQRLRSERRETTELRERLRRQAVTDPLTGLPNRRYFEEFLGAELSRLERHGGRGAVALIDVDDFKNYNDTLGHIAGDEALETLAEVFREKVRVSDVVARYGGEEFALIMINADPDEAHRGAERLRARVEAYPFDREEVQPSGDLTVSVGVACFPEDGRSIEELLQKADEALYAAKRGGKNRVNVAA